MSGQELFTRFCSQAAPGDHGIVIVQDPAYAEKLFREAAEVPGADAREARRAVLDGHGRSLMFRAVEVHGDAHRLAGMNFQWMELEEEPYLFASPLSGRLRTSSPDGKLWFNGEQVER